MDAITKINLETHDKNLMCLHKNGITTYHTCVMQKSDHSFHCIPGKWLFNEIASITIEHTRIVPPQWTYPNNYTFYKFSIIDNKIIPQD